MFGECDRSLKISELAGRSSSGVSGGGVALSPSVLQDDGGDFLAGDVYCTCQSQPPAPPSKKKSFFRGRLLTMSLGDRRAARAMPTGLRRHRSLCFIQWNGS